MQSLARMSVVMAAAVTPSQTAGATVLPQHVRGENTTPAKKKDKQTVWSKPV